MKLLRYYLPRLSSFYGLKYLRIGPVKAHWGKYVWEPESARRRPVTWSAR